MRAGQTVRSTLILAIGLTLCAGMVASCDDDSPRPSTFEGTASKKPSKSAVAHSTAPTPTPTPTATPTPVQERVVHRFVDAVNQAFDTGDVAKLDRLSTRGCTSCQNLIELARGVHTKGGRFTGDPSWDLTSAHLAPRGSVVNAYVKLHAHTVVSSKGAAPERRKAGVLYYEFTVKRQEGRWVVSKIVDAT